MSLEEHTLLDAAHAALQDLNTAGRRAVGVSSGSPAFGQSQMALARATTFEDAMLAALKARFAELKEITK
jgi:hypothetical protein